MTLSIPPSSSGYIINTPTPPHNIFRSPHIIGGSRSSQPLGLAAGGSENSSADWASVVAGFGDLGSGRKRVLGIGREGVKVRQ